MFPIAGLQPSRALSLDRRQSPSSDMADDDDFSRMLRHSSLRPLLPLSEAEHDAYKTHRAELRSTLNHFQLSGIQVSLTDSQEAERDRGDQRIREHVKEMETLRRLDSQQAEIRTQLGEIQGSVASLSAMLASMAERMERTHEDGHSEAVQVWCRLEELGRIHKDMVEILSSRVEALQHPKQQQSEDTRQDEVQRTEPESSTGGLDDIGKCVPCQSQKAQF